MDDKLRDKSTGKGSSTIKQKNTILNKEITFRQKLKYNKEKIAKK